VAIPAAHVRLYEEIFGLAGVLREPVLVFGYQEVRVVPGDDAPVEYAECDNLVELLARRGLHEVEVLDLYDARATLRYDMNRPVPASEHERFATLIDIGCLEHVFDTRQCLENCLGMIRVGGSYVLQTPVNGYFAHGFHVFSPEALLLAFELNGFDLVHKAYTTAGGEDVDDPAESADVLVWLVARKREAVPAFVVPQQSYWESYYREPDRPRRALIQERYWRDVSRL
jgi:hypothetical protein